MASKIRFPRDCHGARHSHILCEEWKEKGLTDKLGEKKTFLEREEEEVKCYARSRATDLSHPEQLCKEASQ